jgi:hypothetical protein
VNERESPVKEDDVAPAIGDVTLEKPTDSFLRVRHIGSPLTAEKAFFELRLGFEMEKFPGRNWPGSPPIHPVRSEY